MQSSQFLVYPSLLNQKANSLDLIRLCAWQRVFLVQPSRCLSYQTCFLSRLCISSSLTLWPQGELNPQPSTLALNPRPSTLNLQPSTLKPQTLNPKPETSTSLASDGLQTRITSSLWHIHLRLQVAWAPDPRSLLPVEALQRQEAQRVEGANRLVRLLARPALARHSPIHTPRLPLPHDIRVLPPLLPRVHGYRRSTSVHRHFRMGLEPLPALLGCKLSVESLSSPGSVSTHLTPETACGATFVTLLSYTLRILHPKRPVACGATFVTLISYTLRIPH